MPSKPKLIPHLWFDKEAKDAAAFYVSLFPESAIKNTTTLSGSPSGDVDLVTFSLWGNPFMAISAGPMFRINPSVSLYVYCGSDAETERLYGLLSENGKVMMPLDNYPWSSKYAWVEDRFGLSWQLDTDAINSPQKIVPSLLFANDKALKVNEAVGFYKSVFSDAKILLEAPYDAAADVPEGTLLFAQFSLHGFLFNAMSSTWHHEFDFNEAISFMIYCDTQEEIDYFWDKLSAGGTQQPCGWLKDRYGVSWQIIPADMDEMMMTADKAQLARVTDAMFKMMKLDAGILQRAYRNE